MQPTERFISKLKIPLPKESGADELFSVRILPLPDRDTDLNLPRSKQFLSGPPSPSRTRHVGTLMQGCGSRRITRNTKVPNHEIAAL